MSQSRILPLRVVGWTNHLLPKDKGHSAWSPISNENNCLWWSLINDHQWLCQCFMLCANDRAVSHIGTVATLTTYLIGCKGLYDAQWSWKIFFKLKPLFSFFYLFLPKQGWKGCIMTHQIFRLIKESKIFIFPYDKNASPPANWPCSLFPPHSP